MEVSKENFFEMVEVKLVFFFFIIEEIVDDVFIISFNMDFFFSGMNFEDVYIVSLLKSVKKYYLLNENE